MSLIADRPQSGSNRASDSGSRRGMFPTRSQGYRPPTAQKVTAESAQDSSRIGQRGQSRQSGEQHAPGSP
jgi:hypothetical protein